MILRRIFSRTFSSSKRRDETKESNDPRPFKKSKKSNNKDSDNGKTNGTRQVGNVEEIENKVVNGGDLPSIKITAPDEENFEGAEDDQAPGTVPASVLPPSSPATHAPTTNPIPTPPPLPPVISDATSGWGNNSSTATIKVPPLPIEVIEIIIDNVADGVTFISCSLVCKEWLARCRFYLFGRIKTPAGNCSEPARILSSPSKAGHFVRSLVITQSSPQLLGEAGSKSYAAAEQLVKAVPNARDLQMFGITDWSLERFLDPLAGQLEDLTLSDVQTVHWGLLHQRLAKCTRLKCLTINTPHLLKRMKKEVPKETGKSNRLTGQDLDTSDDQLHFPNLEKLVLEGQEASSEFVEDLIGGILRSSAATLNSASSALTTLHTLELPMLPSETAPLLVQRLGPSLKELTLHCAQSSWEPSSTLQLDLGTNRNLQTLRFVRIDPSTPRTSTAAFNLLLNLLKSFPYSSLRTIELSFKGHIDTMPIIESWTVKDWWKLDDALSLPNFAQVEKVELVGAFELIGLVGKLLRQTQARKIIHFLT